MTPEEARAFLNSEPVSEDKGDEVKSVPSARIGTADIEQRTAGKWTPELARQFLNSGQPDPDPEEYAGGKVAPDAWEQRAWGWKQEKNWFESGAQALEAAAPPIPHYSIEQGKWEAPREYYDRLYGKDWYDLPFADRVKRLEQLRSEEANRAYPEVAAMVKQHGESFETIQGRLGKAIIAPETLLGGVGVAAKGAKAVSIGKKTLDIAKVGGVWAGTDRLISDVGTKGEFNPTAAVAAAVIGAVLGGGIGFLGMKIGGAVKKKLANSLISRIERDVTHQMAAGITAKEAVKAAYATHGVSRVKKTQLERLTGRVFDFPASRREAHALVTSEAHGVVKNAGGGAARYIADLVRPIYDEIKDKSPRLYGALQRFEAKTMGTVYNDGELVRPFLHGLNKYPAKAQEQIAKALANGDYRRVSRLIKLNGRHMKVPAEATSLVKKKTVDMLEEARVMRNVLEDIFKSANRHGMKLEKLPGYFPRLIKDQKALRAALSTDQKKAVDATISEIEKIGRKKLSDADKASITNKVLQGMVYGKSKTGKLTWSRKRKVAALNDAQMKAYASPAESLHTYIHKMRTEMYRRELLGIGKVRDYDLDTSIDGFLQKQYDTLSGEDAHRIKELLKARLVMGEQHASKWIRNAKSMTYGATLSNPITAATQFQDVGMSMAMNGTWNTLKGIFGPRYAKAIDLGMSNASAEMVNVSKTSHWVNKLLRGSGFQWADRVGKNVHLNARFHQLRAMAMKNPAKLKDEIGHLYLEKEWPKVLQALKNKESNSLVKLALFDRVTQVQPITLGQMPKAYLNNPDLRIAYTLKSFMLRQLGTIYNESLKNFKKTPIKSTAQFAKLMAFVTASGATVGQLQALMKGQWDDTTFTDQMFDNAFKIFGGSAYMADKVGAGRAGDMLAKYVEPAPISVLGNIGDSFIKVIRGDKDLLDTKALSYFPFIGRIAYYRVGGGDKSTTEYGESFDSFDLGNDEYK